MGEVTEIWVFTALPRQGKTLSVVALMRQIWEEEGRKLVTNFHLTKLPYEPLKLPTYANNGKGKKVATVPWHEYRHAFMAFDEIHTMLDGRFSQVPTNTLISYFITQAGKRDVDLVGTTQLFEMPDRRFRLHCHMEIRCRALWTASRDHLVIKRVWVRNPAYTSAATVKKDYLYANPYFDDFDTHEIVHPIYNM